MPPHVRATLTDVTMLSTRRSSVHKIKPIKILKHFENMQTLDMHIYERVVMATPVFRDVWMIVGSMTCGVRFMTEGVNFMTKEKVVS